jgi:hypothetical protein
MIRFYTSIHIIGEISIFLYNYLTESGRCEEYFVLLASDTVSARKDTVQNELRFTAGLGPVNSLQAPAVQ